MTMIVHQARADSFSYTNILIRDTETKNGYNFPLMETIVKFISVMLWP